MIANAPDAAVAASELPYSMALELVVHDPGVIAELSQHPEGEPRDEFAVNALRIGVLAMRQARGQIDIEAVRRESERLLEGLQDRLVNHSQSMQERLASVLKEYFDPQSGRFPERVERLVKKDGDLEQLLRRQIGNSDSELCKTLTNHFGEDSPLMKQLGPDQSKGLLGALRETLEGQLTSQREHVLSQFSLDNKEGALSRFMSELGDRQGNLSKHLSDKLDEVVKEFSLDEENSALSRLVRNVEQAQKTITSEFSLDAETSALSRLKKLLVDTNTAIDGHLSLDDKNSALARLKGELLTMLTENRETNQKFQDEVKLALNTMVARREEADRSTRHGLAFEDAVFQQIQQASQRVGDISSHTGNSTGLIKNCKVGDCLVELGPDSAAPGAKVVIEAKEKAGYDLAEAREEIETARKNREAQIGLFVFSRRTASEGFEPLARYGHDVFVVWDVDDPTSDLFLRAGVSLARALCVRVHNQQEAQSADFTAIDAAILEVEKRFKDFDEMKTWGETIQNNGKKIVDKLRIVRDSLETQVKVLRERTDELKQLSEKPSE
ncbi:MAG: hypothetical protein FJ302_07330 [Planctomycetes bacterium]|nr:hypothetical protein [Planctomycetota bacterium]